MRIERAEDARRRARQLLDMTRARPLTHLEIDELKECVGTVERQREHNALAAARLEYNRLMARVRQA
jgi:hypothetical protein